MALAHKVNPQSTKYATVKPALRNGTDVKVGQGGLDESEELGVVDIQLGRRRERKQAAETDRNLDSAQDAALRGVKKKLVFSQDA